MSECTLCLFSIPCDFILEFLDRVNRIDDRRWGGVVVEGGLYECKRFLVVRQSIMGVDGSSFIGEALSDEFSSSLEHCIQLL